jgi:hypothetical protein
MGEMKPFTRCVDAVWIDGQIEPIVVSSSKDGLSDGVFLAGVNRLNGDGHLPERPYTDIQHDDVLRHFCEQMRCQLGPTWRVEQAQRELRQRIECTGMVREAVVNICDAAWLTETGSVIEQRPWRQRQGV